MQSSPQIYVVPAGSYEMVTHFLALLFIFHTHGVTPEITCSLECRKVPWGLLTWQQRGTHCACSIGMLVSTDHVDFFSFLYSAVIPATSVSQGEMAGKRTSGPAILPNELESEFKQLGFFSADVDHTFNNFSCMWYNTLRNAVFSVAAQFRKWDYTCTPSYSRG